MSTKKVNKRDKKLVSKSQVSEFIKNWCNDIDQIIDETVILSRQPDILFDQYKTHVKLAVFKAAKGMNNWFRNFIGYDKKDICLVNKYIGIIPIIPWVKPRASVNRSQVYKHFSKKYLSNLVLLLEAFFPPLKVKILDPLQMSDNDPIEYRKDKNYSYIYSDKKSKPHKVLKNNGMVNIFDITRALKSILKCSKNAKSDAKLLEQSLRSYNKFNYKPYDLHFDDTDCEDCLSSVIGLTTKQIVQIPSYHNLNVLGRAWGSMWITTTCNWSEKDSLTTILHELLHTYGHLHWDNLNCIMNHYLEDYQGAFLWGKFKFWLGFEFPTDYAN